MGKSKITKIHKNIEKKKFSELEKRGNEFLAEYKVISTKYMMDFTSELEVKTSGIKAVLRLKEREPELEIAPSKPWSLCKRENLDKRMNCHHALSISKETMLGAATDEEIKRLENETPCVTCGLPTKHWLKHEASQDPDGTITIDGEGCTLEYAAAEEEKIKAEEEKEKVEAAEEEFENGQKDVSEPEKAEEIQEDVNK